MSDKKKPPLLLRPRFVLFWLYVFLYALLRMAGIIEAREYQGSDSWFLKPAAVAPNPDKLRWQRQTLRALFSLPMVLEEEARLAAAKGQSAVTERVEDEYRRATDKSEELLRDALRKHTEQLNKK